MSLINLSYDSIHQNHFIPLSLLLCFFFGWHFFPLCLNHSGFIRRTRLFCTKCYRSIGRIVENIKRVRLNRITRIESVSTFFLCEEGEVIYIVMLLLTRLSILFGGYCDSKNLCRIFDGGRNFRILCEWNWKISAHPIRHSKWLWRNKIYLSLLDNYCPQYIFNLFMIFLFWKARPISGYDQIISLYSLSRHRYSNRHR